MRRTVLAVVTGTLLGALVAGPALACGGLIGRNGAVNLVRTSTLAAYADGVEHYVTSFEFAGTGGEFGSIVPLPGVPTSVERGGRWTLQRLAQEVAPPSLADVALEARAAGAPAEVLLETRIDALDLTVLRGGTEAVGTWAGEHGFLLPPDAPEVLDFYARRSPIFLAARFDADAARERDVALGDGTPIHLTIPTANPWVPLRILGLGRTPAERVDADVFLLTERRPALLAAEGRRPSSSEVAPGLALNRQEQASPSLLEDLRSDEGMAWVPESMWLSHLRLAASPGQLTYDLAVDVSGRGEPSRSAAGLLEARTDVTVADGTILERSVRAVGGGARSGAGPTSPAATLLVAMGAMALAVVAAVAVTVRRNA